MPASVCNPIGDWRQNPESSAGVDEWQCLIDGYLICVFGESNDWTCQVIENRDRYDYFDQQWWQDGEYVEPGPDVAWGDLFSERVHAMVAGEHWVLTH